MRNPEKASCRDERNDIYYVLLFGVSRLGYGDTNKTKRSCRRCRWFVKRRMTADGYGMFALPTN